MTEELKTIDTVDTSPFKKLVMTIGELPTSFVESMTYYELLAWLCNYLENTVIPAVNNNAEVSQELQDKFVELKSYVDNYFENLDVQEEINQKLDAMARDGSLTNLIRDYIDPIMSSFQEHIDNEVEQQNIAITNQNSAIDEISTRVNSVVGNDPIPVTSVDDMSDTTKIYVLTTDGYWYYYDGDSWEQGGLFQSAQNSNLLDENVYLRDQYLGNEFSKNLLNQESPYIISGKYLSTSDFATGTNYRCSHPILVKAGVSYTFTTFSAMGNNKSKYGYLDSDLSIINVYSATDNGDNSSSFTAPADGYITFNLYKNESKVVFSKTADYQTTLNYSLKNKFITTSLNNVSDKLHLNNLTYYSNSTNLFDKNSIQIVHQKYITSTGFTDGSQYNISHPIYLNTGDVIKYTMPTILGTNRRFAKCTVDGVFVESYLGTITDGVLSATIPETGYYMFNIGTTSDYSTNFMIVKNMDIPNDYVPFKSELNNVYIPYIDNQLSNLPALNSPLHNKKLGVTGDSICAGAGYNGGYAKIIGDTYNMTVQNVGAGGGTITSGTTYAATGNNRFWINESISTIDSNCDYVLVEGGVNDSGLGVELGAISNGYNDTLDTETYYGAFENMLKQLITRFAGKKYAYVAVHQMTANYRVVNPENTSYYWAAKKCCEKWGVPFIDINSEAPAFGLFTSSMGSLYTMRQNYTYNGDGWHPNEAGYRKYYVDKIVAALESL